MCSNFLRMQRYHPGQQEVLVAGTQRIPLERKWMCGTAVDYDERGELYGSHIRLGLRCFGEKMEYLAILLFVLPGS
jgi:hypothetical protein